MALFNSELWETYELCELRHFFEKLLLIARSVEHLKKLHGDPEFVPTNCRLLPPDFKKLQNDWRWMNQGVSRENRPTYPDQVIQGMLDPGRKNLRRYYYQKIAQTDGRYMELIHLHGEHGRYVIPEILDPEYEGNRISVYEVSICGLEFNVNCYLAPDRCLDIDITYKSLYSDQKIDEPLARKLITNVPVTVYPNLHNCNIRFTYRLPAEAIYQYLELFEGIEERFRPQFVRATIGKFEPAILKLLQDNGVPATKFCVRDMLLLKYEGPVQQAQHELEST